ncbi:MAG: hypothetical protein Kow0077_18700 [Anaerolineae bacterium]
MLSRLRETNRRTLAIVGAMAIIIFMIVSPQIAPTSRFGIACSALAHPIPGGNNGSLLAARSQGALRLQLDLQKRNLALGEPLTVNVTFDNTGVGPVTLFFIPGETLLRNDGTPGLSLEISRLPDRTIFSEPATIRPANPQRPVFPIETLHVLGPRQRCTETITFTPSRLSNLNLTPGNYAIRAIYRNQSAGAIEVPPGATATPIFRTQGVYTTAELASNIIEFSVGLVDQSDEAIPLGG